MLAHLGFENGDRVLGVNGMSLDTPDAALETYTKLREASSLEVELERRGEPRKLKIEVE